MSLRAAIAAVAVALAAAGCAGVVPSGERGTAPPATQAASSDASEPGKRAATFDSGDATLAGDLRLPSGAGPHPGVVLIHGSGPLDRDSVLPGQLAMTFPEPVAVFADLADGLRDAGYAVLTYDKRTCGPFNGCADNGYRRPPSDLTIDVFVADAVAAVGFLRSQAEIRHAAVAIIGHSQGASFVPGMLLDDPDLAAGVMLSAPYDPIDELLAAQADTVAAVVSEIEPRPAGADEQIAQVRQLARTVRGLRRGDAGEQAAVAGATVGFWRSWLRVSDGVPQLAQQAEQPLLVLTGAADTNVDSTQTASWRRTLAGEPDRVAETDCVSHALNCLGADDPRDLDPADIAGEVDPRVISEIASFLDATMPDA